MATVTIGCKIPIGLVLEVGKERITLNGSNKTLIPEYGVGLTEVDKNISDQWFKENSHRSCVVNNLVFVEKTNESARDKAKDLIKVKSGTERIPKQDLDKRKEQQERSLNS